MKRTPSGSGDAKSRVNEQVQSAYRPAAAQRGDAAARRDHRDLGRHADAEHALEVGAVRDGVRDAVGAAGRERAREVPAAAVPDQRDAPAVTAVELLDAPLDALERAVRAVDVGDEAAVVGG